MTEKLYIVMPAYNEAENIESVAREWYPIVEKVGGGSRLVIFDDGSKDDTYERMRRLQDEMPLFTPQTKPNSGHGATCIYAYQWALEQGADWVFQTDSDGQTSPDDFWQLWERRTNYDLLIGARTARQDGVSRVVVTRTLRLLLMLMFGVWVRDANAPFRLVSNAFLRFALQIIPDKFFLANVAMSVIACKQKHPILWLPITFRQRQGGINSINLKRIVKIGIKAIGDFRKINKILNN